MKPDIAVIDIGSNSVRLMLAAAEDEYVRALSKELDTTRLAKGLDATRALAEDRMADTIRAIGQFSEKARSLDVPILAYATSAVRDAENREVFLARVLEETGVAVRVLSGEEEGDLAFSAVTGGVGTMFDVGGGSFQIVTKKRSVSFPCGCVRAKDRCDASDPETLRNELYAWMDERTDLPDSTPVPVYGVGGTITTIGALLAAQKRYDPNELLTITPDRLHSLIQLLCAIPEPQRMKLPLLHRRGDVILQGATILRYMMERTHTDAVIPSDRDGMEGIAQAILFGNECNGGNPHERQ